MANEVGRGYVDILPDMSGFQQRVGREVEQATSKASQRAQKAINIGAGLTAGVTLPVAAALTGAVNLASDLEQSVGAVESVFGDAADTIFDFGETSAESFGLAREEVNRLAAQVGAQLKGMGLSADEAAEQTLILQERAADLAATFGGSTSDAIQAIAALLRGERDPIEKYGVSLKQVDINARIAAKGMDTSTVAAEKQATATAALELLLEQTADAAGQFGRESDTLAGQQARAEAKFKDAAAALGTELLPIATDAIEVVSEMVDIFADLPEPVQKSIVAAAGMAAALGPLLVVGGSAAKGITAVKAAVESMRAARAARAATDIATGYSAIGSSAASSITSVKGLVGQVGLVTAGAGAALFAIDQFGTALDEALHGQAAEADELSLALQGLATNGRVPDSVLESFEDLDDSLNRIAAPGWGDVGQAHLPSWLQAPMWKRARDEVEAFDSALAEAVAAGDTDALAAGMDILGDKADELGIPLEELIEKHFPEYAQAADAAAVASEKEAAASGESADAAEDNAEAHEETADAVDRAKQAHEDYNDALRAATDPVFALNKAIQGVDEAQQAYNDTLKDEEATQEDVRQASLDLAEAVSRAEQAAIDGDLSFQQFEGKLRDWVKQGLVTEEQAENMRARVAELRGESEDYEGTYRAYMEAQTREANSAIQELRRQLDDLTGRRYTITIDQRFGALVGTPGGGGRLVEGRAHGGPLGADQLALVGEEGPEFLKLGAASHVTSNDDSIRAMSEAIVRAIRDEGGGQRNDFSAVVYTTDREAADDTVHALKRLAMAGR